MKSFHFILIYLILFTTNLFAQTIYQTLETAYRPQDTELLDSILSNWNKSIHSNQHLIHDQTIASVYTVFNTFYSPHRAKKIGASKQLESLYQDKYVIVQGSITYGLAPFPNPDSILCELEDTTLALSEIERKYGTESNYYKAFEFERYPHRYDIEERKLTDFRPLTRIKHSKRLYLTEDYRLTLLQFLQPTYNPLRPHGVKDTKYIKDEAYKRMLFLNQHLMLFKKLWTQGWHLESNPVRLVILNPELTKAIVYFRLEYQGGHTYLEKIKGKWKIIESKLTWIE